eukprot:CAMPEP_0117450520 /NCGR_PEP_ID=MMETSP0759-20121206/8511_1 /TAXON_ID=63605 /ORGANISM="Percolomonas cosmopolitus, Strain WS" /LENGTH=304 /DNA_ID=CAMNT_0005243045 /DNA_START=163 /DNA_END=1077 /DNA_ORIENTATION=+
MKTMDCAALEAPSDASAAASSHTASDTKSRDQLIDQYKSLISSGWHSKCLESKKGWWTYRVCFGEEAKQFHGNDVYALGHDYNVLAHDVVEFTNGGTCEAAQQQKNVNNLSEEDRIVDKRVSRVHLMCGSVFALVDVQEKEVCQYFMLVTSPELCTHVEKDGDKESGEPVLYETYTKEQISSSSLAQSNRDVWVLSWEDEKLFSSPQPAGSIVKGAEITLKRVNQEIKLKRNVCVDEIRIELGASLEQDRILSVDVFEDSFKPLGDVMQISGTQQGGGSGTTLSTKRGFTGKIDMVRIRISLVQ